MMELVDMPGRSTILSISRLWTCHLKGSEGVSGPHFVTQLKGYSTFHLVTYFVWEVAHSGKKVTQGEVDTSSWSDSKTVANVDKIKLSPHTSKWERKRNKDQQETTAGLLFLETHTDIQFGKQLEGLRHFRDHRWKALGKENPDFSGLFWFRQYFEGYIE